KGSAAMDQVSFAATVNKLIDQIETVIVGKRSVVEMTVIGFLCGGHLLIEDIPGVGKTMLARSLARSVDLTFKRIQFTPDLLPSDVTGVSIYNQSSSQFEFRPGPIFGNVVLADEINRATPKSQAALLEAMEEFQVTVDGVAHPLPKPFFVIATENPIEYEGTYSLPEAQLDRFLMRLALGYPSATDEVMILDRQIMQHPIEKVGPVANAGEILALQQMVRKVHVDHSLRQYMVALVGASRRHEAVELGASPRGSIALLRCSQGLAAIRGRGYVTPDDVKDVAESALAHRLIMKPQSRLQGVTPGQVVTDLLNSVPVPVVEERRK
ncbi:MAG: MoxR family ATPase, partial [Armatimonadia bacterium]